MFITIDTFESLRLESLRLVRLQGGKARVINNTTIIMAGQDDGLVNPKKIGLAQTAMGKVPQDPKGAIEDYLSRLSVSLGRGT